MDDGAAPKIAKAEMVAVIADRLARETPDFFAVKGPGAGDRANRSFMQQLRELARGSFGADYAERQLCTGTKFAVAFYFPDEATAVELAFGMHNPISEYERDLFKCFLAIDAGYAIRKLLFITKPNGYRKLQEPAPRAIAAWAKKHVGLEIDILELRPSQDSDGAR